MTMNTPETQLQSEPEVRSNRIVMPRSGSVSSCNDLLHGPNSFILGNPLLGSFSRVIAGEAANLNIFAAFGIPPFYAQKSIRKKLAIGGRPPSEFSVFADEEAQVRPERKD